MRTGSLTNLEYYGSLEDSGSLEYYVSLEDYGSVNFCQLWQLGRLWEFGQL